VVFSAITRTQTHLKQTLWPESASEHYRFSDSRLSAKLVTTFVDGGVRSQRGGRNPGFLGRSRYFFFQAAPQLYSRGRVDTVPDPLLLRKHVSAGIEPGPLDL
jgi:hypothetical protein